MTAVRRRGGVSIVAFGMALGCSSRSLDRETIGTTSAPAIVTQGSGCTVEWVKMDYREPGGDLSQYIELQVTKGNALVQTLGDCGLGSLVLMQASCTAPVQVIPLQTVVIPNDGYVDVCAAGLDGGTCDVIVGSNPWISPGHGELVFVSVAAGIEAGVPLDAALADGGASAPLFGATWEGAAQCALTQSAPTVVVVQTESIDSPNLVNVWCANQFTLTDETVVLRRQAGPCASSDAGTDVSTAGDANTDGAEGDVPTIDAQVTDAQVTDAQVTCTDAGNCTNGPICTIGRCVTGFCVFDSLLDCDAGSRDMDGSSPEANGPNDGSLVGDGPTFEGSSVIDGSGPDRLAGDASLVDAPRADGSSGDDSAIGTGAGGGSGADGSTDAGIGSDGRAGSGLIGGQSGSGGSLPDSSGGSLPDSSGGSPEPALSDAFVEGGGCSCSFPGRSKADASSALLLLGLAVTRFRRFRARTVQPKS